MNDRGHRSPSRLEATLAGAFAVAVAVCMLAMLGALTWRVVVRLVGSTTPPRAVTCGGVTP